MRQDLDHDTYVGYTHSGGATYNESEQFGSLTGQSASETSAMTPLVTAFHQTQEPIHGDDFSPATGGTSIGTGVGVGASVRRLLPVECERLQGLPDGWTQLGKTPDSRRYAALGDAVTASVGEWLGRRLAAA